MKLNRYIDHTLLNPSASGTEIEQLCKEAIEHQFYGVCVHGCYTASAEANLHNSQVKIVTVVGFPLGASTTTVKIAEAEDALTHGADELDMVLNLGWLKSNAYNNVEEEIRLVKSVMPDRILKVIIETALLTTEEKRIATQLVINAGADFVKTSTGFANGGATIEDILLMKKITKDQIKIKASGGIKTATLAQQYISLGVSRIGTSAGIALMT